MEVVPDSMDCDLDAFILIISGQSHAHMAMRPILRQWWLVSLCDGSRITFTCWRSDFKRLAFPTGLLLEVRSSKYH